MIMSHMMFIFIDFVADLPGSSGRFLARCNLILGRWQMELNEDLPAVLYIKKKSEMRGCSKYITVGTNTPDITKL